MEEGTEIVIQAPGQAMGAQSKRGRGDYISKGVQDHDGKTHRDS